jgi:hypothetical protein
MANVDDDCPRKALHIGGSVGEGGDNNMADVIGVEIHLNLFIGTGALKGAKMLFTLGVMTEEFKDVIRKFQKQVAGLSNPDGRVDPNGTTLKYLNGPLTARGGSYKPGPIAPPPADVADARRRIVEKARELLREGGHFLIGAMGDMPGSANGHANRLAYTKPITVIDEHHSTRLGPAVNAAWCSTGRHGTLGCMGRPGKVKIPLDAIPAGSAKGATIASYAEAIKRMRDAEVPIHRWPAFEVYETSKAKFDAAHSFADFDLILITTTATGRQFPRRVLPGGPFHLGESCTGRRHYDCIGFVNYVLSKVVSPLFQLPIEFFATPQPKSRFDITVFKDKSDVFALAEPGDLVFKEPSEAHCGIVTTFGEDRVVTNCRSISVGLINSTLTAEWNSLAKLKYV